MPLTIDELLDFLAINKIDAPTFSHAAVNTVAESQALRGDIPGVHTKNLFLRDGGKQFFLVVTEENAHVDLKALRGRIGARGGISFGSAEALYENLGVRPGAVTLLAAVNDTSQKVKIVIDRNLLEADSINCHPLTNERTTSLTPVQLLKFLSLIGHEALLISLDDVNKTRS